MHPGWEALEEEVEEGLGGGWSLIGVKGDFEMVLGGVRVTWKGDT